MPLLLSKVLSCKCRELSCKSRLRILIGPNSTRIMSSLLSALPDKLGLEGKENLWQNLFPKGFQHSCIHPHFVGLVLKAPTGALYVMARCYGYSKSFHFHSAHCCNWCHSICLSWGLLGNDLGTFSISSVSSLDFFLLEHTSGVFWFRQELFTLWCTTADPESRIWIAIRWHEQGTWWLHQRQFKLSLKNARNELEADIHFVSHTSWLISSEAQKPHWVPTEIYPFMSWASSS